MSIRNRTAALFCLAAYLYSLTSVGLTLKLLLFALAWYPTGGDKWCDLVKNTWTRDVT